jgi:hypothetical protein
MESKLMTEENQDFEERKSELENQEVWVRLFFSGYFFKFINMALCLHIEEINPDFPEKSCVSGTTYVYPAIDEEHGYIDITPMLYELYAKLKENPQANLKCIVTGFGPSMKRYFDKDLLTKPIPEELISLFDKIRRKQ